MCEQTYELVAVSHCYRRELKLAQRDQSMPMDFNISFLIDRLASLSESIK